jgi:DNA repair exonuclease SbcCD ATPase subunit
MSHAGERVATRSIATVLGMAAVDQVMRAPTFTVVRRGYDPTQVTAHLTWLDADMKILATDRAAAVEQANQLRRELDRTRTELDAAKTEVEQLRAELRTLADPPDSLDRLTERLNVMRRLAAAEFGGERSAAAEQAAAYTAEVVASVRGEPGQTDMLAGWPPPELDGDLDRMLLEAAQERTRLDQAAIAARAAADEEFRQTLVLRCREALVQIAAMQMEGKRVAQRMLQDAEEQAKAMIAEAREKARVARAEAQREVDHLNDLRSRLARQLDASRNLIGRPAEEQRGTSAVGSKTHV